MQFIQIVLCCHAFVTRIGLMDSAVSVEALVCGVTHPRQGMPICRNGCPRTVSNPQRGFMFSGLPKHCCARCATPHGVVGAAASPTATDREPLTGFGARSGTSLSTTSPSVACSVRKHRHTPPCLTPPPTRHASGTRIGLMDSAVPVEAMIGVWEV